MRRLDRNAPLPAVEWLLAAAVGCALWWLSEWLVPAAQAPFGAGNRGHGWIFAEMSRAPFELTGDFPQRKLWPTLAWLFGKVGVTPVVFSQACSAALLAVVFWFARRRRLAVPDASLVTAAIAASGAVLVYKPMTCFSDSLNLLLLVLLVHFAARPFVFWPLVFVSALSHELVFFFAPWLVYLRCKNGGVWWREGLALAFVLGAYLLFRAPMASSYGISYYLEKNFWVPWLLPALWALWLLVVVVEFGPLLLFIGWGAGSRGALAQRDAFGGRWGLWLYVAGMLPLMLLAYDVMRFATFLFLPVLLGAIAATRAARGRVALVVALVAACASYSWLHPNPAEQGGRHFTEIAADVFGKAVPIAVRSGPGPFPFGEAVDLQVGMMRSWWGTFALFGAGAVALLALGRALARDSSPAPEHPGDSSS